MILAARTPVLRPLAALIVPWLLASSAGIRAASPPAPPADTRAAEYAARAPKTILQLQQFRRSTSVGMIDAAGNRGLATLVDLNPAINAWFLLNLEWPGGNAGAGFHLENPSPSGQRVTLSEEFPAGIVLADDGGELRCELWSGYGKGALADARRSGLPYAPLCNGRLYLRNPVEGRRSGLEAVTDFLRDHVWGGEEIVGFVREQAFQDAYLQRGTPAGPAACPPPSAATPLAADMNDAAIGRSVVPQHLSIGLDARTGSLALGCWYPVTDIAGAWVSAFEPRAAAAEILEGHRDRVRNLDGVEASALVYLVAFDLDRFDLQYELGTDHPRLGWSDRTVAAMRDRRLPGPDGIAKAAPLVTTGMVAPSATADTVAVFTGGFKRTHSAFRYGDLAQRNQGSHYGFIENGTVFSKLQPGLSTLYVLADGRVDMKTWDEDDNRVLADIRHARQNGVPLIRFDPDTGVSAPGNLVARWGPGNWSGSAEGKLRALRAGACLQETPLGRFLIYGYFSSATPSAMARVFQAYDCRDAMLLDMNALEHTYLALYTRHDGRIVVHHLIDGMTEVDKQTGGELLPRFIGFPDNRDFFYLVRRRP